MYGPADAIKEFYSAIPGSSVFDESQGFYQFPCSSVPTVAFNWGGKDWSVSDAKYVRSLCDQFHFVDSFCSFNLGETETGSGQCVGSLIGGDLGLGSNVWLLGDSFMKNVYTSFDFGKDQVGFATLA